MIGGGSPSCRATARSNSSRSAFFCKLGWRVGPAQALGQRACRGGASGEIEPAVLAVVVELAAGERVPEIGRGEALDNGALAEQLVQPPLCRGEAIERDLRMDVVRRVIHDVVRDRAVPGGRHDMHRELLLAG